MAAPATFLALAVCLVCAAGQLADNLMVAGSNQPFAEGVGTYGLPRRGEGGLVSSKMPSVLVTDFASGAFFANGRGDTTHYNSTAEALLALASFLGRDIDKQVARGRRLAQQPPAKLSTSDMVATGLAAARQYFSEDSQLQHKKGGLPTISTQDGTLQIISNNDSGNEFQVAKDGTITFVNGGLSPGIFSIGPNGVTLNKDNALGPLQAMAKAISRAANGSGAGSEADATAARDAAGAPAAADADAAPASRQSSHAAAAASGAATGAPALGGLPSPVSAEAAQQVAPVLGSIQQDGSAALQSRTATATAALPSAALSARTHAALAPAYGPATTQALRAGARSSTRATAYSAAVVPDAAPLTGSSRPGRESAGETTSGTYLTGRRRLLRIQGQAV